VTGLSRAELKAMSPADLERLESVLEQVVAERESGKVPWRCLRPGCDGQPHPGRMGRHARADQVEPDGDDWDNWLCLAGRGWGKTRTGAEWAIEQARHHGDKSRGALVGRTAADVRDTMIEGESGILAVAPATFRPVYNPSKRLLTYPNGAMQYAYASAEPEALRGPQHHYAWADELAAWKYLQYTWDMLKMGLRLGTHPRVVVTTTPRPLPLVKELVKSDRARISKGTTYDNLDNLAETFKRTVLDKYEGTTLGRQELNAEILEDLPGALVARQLIEQGRVDYDDMPELVAIAVAMDPAGTGTGDETGLMAAGYGVDGHHYVLEDASRQATPDVACRAAYALMERHGASVIVVEDNGGKDWIELGLKRVWQDMHPNDTTPAPIRRVNASQGKKLRAQPVAMLYEQHKVHHVGVFAELEDQLTTWIPEEDPQSPDRLDALVHVIVHHSRRELLATKVAKPSELSRRPGRGPAVHPALAARQRATARGRARTTSS